VIGQCVTASDAVRFPQAQARGVERVGKAEHARWLNCHLPQVDRLLDLRHASRLDQLEAAFRTLGKQLSIEICEAA
jgi:antitoxin HicB